MNIPPLLESSVAEQILAAIGKNATEIMVSLDLGLSTEEVQLYADKAVARGHTIDLQSLRTILQKGTVVFKLGPDGIEPLEVRGRGYAKLVPCSGAPTIEMSGVRMHRTAGINPFDDARLKVEAVVRSGDIVLDTCGGLGYTATWARRLGARRVVSIEIDPDVLYLRRLNPWTSEYL